MQGLKHFLLALQFFTRIPVTGALAAWVGYSPTMLRASTAHFPAVGWVVGTVAAGVYALLCLHLPSAVGVTLVAAVLSTVATVLVTGGFHEDGLADLSDGLGGSYSRERALEIMKDSRVGAFGAMALVLALLAKVALLALLGQVSLASAVLALWLGHVVSRTWPLLTIRGLPHVGDVAGSKSKPLADQISGPVLATALAWCAAAVALALFMEVAELVDSYSWKPWRESVPVDIENLKRELVDIHFFLVHIMNCFGIWPEDLNQKFEEVIANNEKRYVKKPYTNPPMFIKVN